MRALVSRVDDAAGNRLVRATALGAQDLDGEQADVGGEAGDADAVVGRSGRDTGAVGAVTLVVHRILIVVDEVAALVHATGEVGVVVVDTGVDDGEEGLLGTHGHVPGLSGADLGDRPLLGEAGVVDDLLDGVVHHAHFVVGLSVDHVGVLLELGDRGLGVAGDGHLADAGVVDANLLHAELGAHGVDGAGGDAGAELHNDLAGDRDGIDGHILGAVHVAGERGAHSTAGQRQGGGDDREGGDLANVLHPVLLKWGEGVNRVTYLQGASPLNRGRGGPPPG
ncbi:hypothetical protein D3C86_960300 [compost metagenome]